MGLDPDRLEHAAGIRRVAVGEDEAPPRQARKKLAGFAKLAAKTKVKACYHTHSGNTLGNNAAGLRLLVQDLDAHQIGVFFDTGHTAVNGGPVRMELDLIRPWLSLVAIKDMAWEKGKGGWRSSVVPVGDGIVRWDEFGKGLKECKFAGTVSVHGEYEAADLDERKRWDDYRQAYEDALERCSTDWAPWYVIPADRKWVRNLAVSEVLAETLEELDPHYPPVDPEVPADLVVT